jgi:hypothetical protein
MRPWGPVPASAACPQGPFHHNVVDPFKIVGFTDHHGTVAILATGAPGFRDSQRYLRHVRSLARYHSVLDLQRRPPV